MAKKTKEETQSLVALVVDEPDQVGNPEAEPPTQETATTVAVADEDNLSSSELSKSFASPADLDAIKALSADELHQEIMHGFIDLVEDSIQFEALVLDARRRMNDYRLGNSGGEPVGGCDTWSGPGGYVDTHFRRENESLATALRRLRRALEDNNPANRYRNKRTKKSNPIPVEEGPERKAEARYEEGIEEGKRIAKAELKAKAFEVEFEAMVDGEIEAVRPQAVQPAAADEPTTTKTNVETFNVVRRKSDGFYFRDNRTPRFIKEVDRAFRFEDEREDFDKEMQERFLCDVFTDEQKRCKREKKTFNPTDYEVVTVKIVTTTATTVTPVGPFVPPPDQNADPEGPVASGPAQSNGAKYCSVDGCEQGPVLWVWNPLDGEQPDKLEVCMNHALSRRLSWRSGRLYDTVAVVQP